MSGRELQEGGAASYGQWRAMSCSQLRQVAVSHWYINSCTGLLVLNNIFIKRLYFLKQRNVMRRVTFFMFWQSSLESGLIECSWMLAFASASILLQNAVLLEVEMKLEKGGVLK